MFSPLLDTDLYEQDQPKIKEKKLASKRLFASDDDPEENINQYNEEEHYSAHRGNNSIELKNKGVVKSSSNTHNTN